MHRTLLATIAAGSLLVGSQAKADLILTKADGTPATTVADSFTDIGAQGFGNAPRMLTLQTKDFETGSVTPVNVVHDNAISGADKSTTPTISTIGWTSGASVGIGFNSDQSSTGITMQSLTLTIYNGTTAVGSFSLAASLTPLLFTDTDLSMEPGNGNAVFNFGLDATQQAAFDAIVAQSGSSGYFAGLASSLGCSTTPVAPGCLVSNDGPDSFVAFVQPSVVPAPLLGHGLLVFLTIGGVLVGSKFLEGRHRIGVANS